MKPVHCLCLMPLMLAACVPMAAPDVPVSTSNLVSSSGAVLGTVRVYSEPTGVMLRINASGLPAGAVLWINGRKPFTAKLRAS